MSLLQVRDLRVRYRTPRGVATVVDGVDLDLQPGATLGIVGESGSGKSQTALAIMGLLPGSAMISGRIRFEGRDLLGQSRSAWDRVRGTGLAMVFQDPSSTLNPHLTLAQQMTEMLRVHRGSSLAAALAASLRMLDAVRLSGGAVRLQQFPHELSGGQRQRVSIAMSLLCEPRLLIADEPTTALDVSVQAQIVALLAQLRRDLNLSLLLIAHDLMLVGELCEHALVLYAGRAMEQGPTADLLASPAHPYTQALLAARPRVDRVVHGPLPAIAGTAPDPVRPVGGCVFHPRCRRAEARCTQETPARQERGARKLDCHFADAQI